ncbi:MAG: transporter substrate-binding domain-containing protein [Burkholderiaceae bacterium]|nr:transporter substrate-binding domain-containing protein [Burkholderiaceae bacterium]
MLITRIQNLICKQMAALRAVQRPLVAGLIMTASLISASQASTHNKPPALFDRLPASVKSTKVLKLVGDSFAPYRIVGEDGKTVTGIDTDLARGLEPILGVKIEQTIVSNLPAMLAGIDTGRYDFTTGPLLSTAAREERYDLLTWLLSKPAFALPVSAGRKTSRLEDLCGLRISYPAGSAQERYVKMVTERCLSAGLAAMQPVGLSDQNATVLAAQAGRADVVGMQLAAALYLQKQNPGKFHIQTDQTDGLGILHQGFVLKKNSELSPVLLDALKQLWASGEYDRIMTKWGMGLSKVSEPKLNPASSK